MIISLLPLASIIDPELSEKEIYINFESMKKIDNYDLNILAQDIEFINIFLWSTIILCLISFLGMIIIISNRFKIFGKIFFSLGIGSSLTSILAITFLLSLIINIGNSSNILYSTFSGPVKYLYFPLTFLILLVISSLYFLFNTVLNFKFYLRKNKNNISVKESKKPVYYYNLSNQAESNKKKDFQKSSTDNKESGITMVKPSVDYHKKTELLNELELEQNQFKIKGENTSKKDSPPKYEKTSDNNFTPFSNDKKEKEKITSKNFQTNLSFDEALDNAIKKKKLRKNDDKK